MSSSRSGQYRIVITILKRYAPIFISLKTDGSKRISVNTLRVHCMDLDWSVELNFLCTQKNSAMNKAPLLKIVLKICHNYVNLIHKLLFGEPYFFWIWVTSLWPFSFFFGPSPVSKFSFGTTYPYTAKH